MQSISKSVLLTLILALSLTVQGSLVKGDTLSYEILLNPKLLRDLSIEDSFIGSFDITANNLIMISSADQFYLVGWGGMLPYGKPVTGDIRSFALTHDSTLLYVRNDELCYFDAESELSVLFKLPGKNMGIAKGRELMYLYDRPGNRETYSVYAIAPGGKYSRVLEMPEPINTLVEIDNSILFASGSGLFRFDLRSKELKAITVLPAEKEIISVAVDKAAGRVYFSTGNEIYALKDKGAVIVSYDLGGVLRFYGDGLIVFSPEDQLLLRITGIEKEITKGRSPEAVLDIKQPADILTNSLVIDLVKSGLSDNLIISLISRTKVDFNMSVDGMIELSSGGVSSDVIMAMRQAMRDQASRTQIK